METRAHHTLIGAFTLLVLAAALGFVLWLSKQNGADAYSDYDIVFNEAVTGLSKGAAVQYNGIKIGEVTNLKLDPADTRRVVVRVRIADPSPVRQDTQATLGFTGVTGVAHVRLSGGDPHSPELAAAAGSRVPTILASPSDIAKLKASGEDIMLNINQSLEHLSGLLSAENVAHFSAIIRHVDEVSGSVAEQREQLASAIRELSAASTELRTTLVSVNATAQSADTLIRQDAHQTLQSIDQALKSIDQTVLTANALLNDNRAAVASFGQQGLRQIGPTLSDLRDTLDSLQQLSDQLSRSDSALLGNTQPKEFKP